MQLPSYGAETASSVIEPSVSTTQPMGCISESIGSTRQPTGWINHPSGWISKPYASIIQTNGLISQPSGSIAKPISWMIEPTVCMTETIGWNASKADILTENVVFDAGKPSWVLDSALTGPELMFLEPEMRNSGLSKINASSQTRFEVATRPAPGKATVLRNPHATQALNPKG